MSIKHGTSLLPINLPPVPPNATFPSWQDHPSWLTGIDAIGAYHRWVSMVVLPIAFEWIYEHYDTIYSDIPKHLHDDVGVVIAKAFQLVQQADGYKEALVKLAEFRKLQTDGTLDTNNLNPIWTRITDRVRHTTEDIFEGERQYLDDTI